MHCEFVKENNVEEKGFCINRGGNNFFQHIWDTHVLVPRWFFWLHMFRQYRLCVSFCSILVITLPRNKHTCLFLLMAKSLSTPFDGYGLLIFTRQSLALLLSSAGFVKSTSNLENKKVIILLIKSS